VLLIGAELDAEIEHQTCRDSTVGPPKPMGTRGATMADTIGHRADEYALVLISSLDADSLVTT
jgi:membrane protein